MGQPCFEDKLQELNSDFAKICISPKPSGAPMGKVPLQVLKELEQQARQNLSTINIALFLQRLPPLATLLWRSVRTVLNLPSKGLKARFRRVPILKKTARCGYKNTCDYFEMLNKRILIQQRALACLSKSLAHILHRELYTMGNTDLLRCEAEMTPLQPHLGDSRQQELWNSPFWPIRLSSHN